MSLKILLLLLIGVSVFIGCFGEVDNPLQEEGGEADAADVPEEVPVNEEPLPLPQGPVVRLVSEGIMELGKEKLFLGCHAEIDAPLDHHLLIYVEMKKWNQEDFFGFPGEIEVGQSLIIIEKGNTRSGSFGTGTFRGRHMHKKLMRRLLPGEDRLDITLPTQFYFGVIDGVVRETDFGDVPEEYQFNPYQVGEPSEVSHEFDEDELAFD